MEKINLKLLLTIPFLIVFLSVPFVAFADTYKDAAGTSQMIADSFSAFWSFLYEDTPDFFQRIFNYVYEYVVSIKIYFIKMAVIASWKIGKEMIESFQIMSLITSNISALSPDVRQAFVDMRLFDGINLLIQAHVTKFILRL